MSRTANLQNALDRYNTRKPQPATSEGPAAAKNAKQRQASRVGHVNLAAWLPGDFKKSIRLVQAKKLDNSAFQDLMAEALNDLFVKYNVPTVAYPAD
ncbi:MAG: hypothetical protein JO108_28230 [Acidobacteriaceae bacterium]|nr:hypothetical protein [Acidobacteriaceae bacterium]